MLGAQMAVAEAAEARRKQVGPSPMPQEGYQSSRGETDLLRFRPAALDALLTEVCQRYASLPDAERAAWRGSISLDEFYTLLMFADRKVVLALREHNPAHVRDGLIAVSMIEHERVDYRDIPLTLSKLSHAFARTARSGDDAFTETARLAEPWVAGAIRVAAAAHDMRPASGCCEVVTKYGIGLAGWGHDPYDPAYDLTSVAVDIADLLEANGYQSTHIQLASTLPDVWLSKAGDPRLQQILGRVQAGAYASGGTGVRADPAGWDQIVWAWVVQMPTASDVKTLQEIAEKNRPSSYCTLCVAVERVACVLVASSPVYGVDTIETVDTLQRFAAPVAATLAAACSGTSSLP